MSPPVQYIVHAEWLWKAGKCLPRKVAFAPIAAPQATLVIVPTKTSCGLFNVEDILTNIQVNPFNGFQEDPIQGQYFTVEMVSFFSFVKGEFFQQVLEHPKEGILTLGTYDLATFLMFRGHLKDQIVYLGPKINAEEEAIRKASE